MTDHPAGLDARACLERCREQLANLRLGPHKAISELLAEIDRVLEAPAKELPRYGIKWVGPQQPIAVPMADGYWTPWHVAMGIPSMSVYEACDCPAEVGEPCPLSETECASRIRKTLEEFGVGAPPPARGERE